MNYFYFPFLMQCYPEASSKYKRIRLRYFFYFAWLYFDIYGNQACSDLYSFWLEILPWNIYYLDLANSILFSTSLRSQITKPNFKE